MKIKYKLPKAFSQHIAKVSESVDGIASKLNWPVYRVIYSLSEKRLRNCAEIAAIAKALRLEYTVLCNLLKDDSPDGCDAMEGRVGDFICSQAPLAFLKNIVLYQPHGGGGKRDWMPHGRELDFLLHWRSVGGVDRLVVIECKAQDLASDWKYVSGGEEKDLRTQLREEAFAIWRNMPNVSFLERPKIELVAVSLSVDGGHEMGFSETPKGDSSMRMHLISEVKLEQLFRDKLTGFAQLFGDLGGGFLSVDKSCYLRRLVHQHVLPEIGHPEPVHAVRYIAECRKNLDLQLFKKFKYDKLNPRSSVYAVNGTAGMGKSVLLAYISYVLSSRRELSLIDTPGFGGEAFPVDDKFNWLPSRRILFCGMHHKQREMLKVLWNRFEQVYMDRSGERFACLIPNFEVMKKTLSLNDYDIILVDEAHDLGEENGLSELVEWINKSTSSNPRLLVLGCDRHQMIKSKKFVPGKKLDLLPGVTLDRSNICRLDQNYRSPVPVYIASLSLLFRWFGAEGVKVVPDVKAMKDAFSFNASFMNFNNERTPINQLKEGGVAEVKCSFDSHPGNHWRNLVIPFESGNPSLEWLKIQGFRRDDVLWVRFSPPDHEFDYDFISEKFTYHALCSSDSTKIIDSYIKGREFPVVVIEGVPEDFDFEDWGKVSDASKQSLWVARRQMYLCSSRARAFLLFVRSKGERECVWNEITDICSSVSAPSNSDDASSKCWKIKFDIPEAASCERLADYHELIEVDQDVEVTASVNEPIVAFDGDSKPLTVTPFVDTPIDVKLKVSNKWGGSEALGSPVNIIAAPSGDADVYVIRSWPAARRMTVKQIADEIGNVSFETIAHHVERHFRCKLIGKGPTAMVGAEVVSTLFKKLEARPRMREGEDIPHWLYNALSRK